MNSSLRTIASARTTTSRSGKPNGMRTGRLRSFGSPGPEPRRKGRPDTARRTPRSAASARRSRSLPLKRWERGGRTTSGTARRTARSASRPHRLRRRPATPASQDPTRSCSEDAAGARAGAARPPTVRAVTEAPKTAGAQGTAARWEERAWREPVAGRERRVRGRPSRLPHRPGCTGDPRGDRGTGAGGGTRCDNVA